MIIYRYIHFDIAHYGLILQINTIKNQNPLKFHLRLLKNKVKNIIGLTVIWKDRNVLNKIKDIQRVIFVDFIAILLIPLGSAHPEFKSRPPRYVFKFFLLYFFR